MFLIQLAGSARQGKGVDQLWPLRRSHHRLKPVAVLEGQMELGSFRRSHLNREISSVLLLLEGKCEWMPHSV